MVYFLYLFDWPVATTVITTTNIIATTPQLPLSTKYHNHYLFSDNFTLLHDKVYVLLVLCVCFWYYVCM